MKKTIAKKVIMIVLLLIEVLLISFVVFSQNRQFVYLMTIVTFILSFFIVLLKIGKFCSFPTIFIVLMFFFHASYFALWLSDYRLNNSVLYNIEEYYWVTTAKYCCYYMLSFGLSSFLFFDKKKKTKENDILNMEQLRNVGLLLFWICLIPRLYSDITMIIAYARGGYIATYNAISHGFIETFAEGFFFGIMFLIIANREKKEICKKYFIIGIIVAVFGMISGRRQEKIVFLVSIIIIYYKYVNSINEVTFKTIFKYLLTFIGLYAGVVIVATFGDIRSSGSLSLVDFISLYTRNLSRDFLFDQMGEYGYTGYTYAASIRHFSNGVYGYGKNYFITWLQVFPNIKGIYTSIISKMSFTSELPSIYQHYIGGSVLGELYYNFGKFSFFFMLILNILVYKIQYNLDSAVDRGKFTIKEILSLLLIPLFMLWIRGDFTYICRPLVWYFVITLLFKNIKFRKKAY